MTNRIEIEYELKAEEDDDIQAYVKPWVGLTEEEFILYSSYVYPEILTEIENLLRDKNT